MRGLRVWAKRAKREKRAKLAKRRAQLAILTAALGFASWSVWGGASVENVGNVASASAFAYDPSSDRRLSAESALKPKALPNHKAFIVGASDYINKNVPDLEGVKNDVEALTARLVEIGFEEKNIAVLIDGRGSDSLPTKDNIERRFNEFVDNLQEGDNVVLYLSGHGVQKGEDKTKETFFVPIDVNISSEVETYASSVSVDAMISRLEKNKAAEFRLAIIDACREKLGKSISGEIGGARRIASMIDAPKSVSVLYSCEPDKLSFEDEADGDGVRHGFFTRGLLDALDVNDNKADVDNDGELTFLEFVKYVSERTESLARAQGKEQKPRHFFAAETGDFVFLSDLLVDGLPRAKWNEAEKLYRDALELRNAEKWPEALQKIRDARKINPKREQYKTAEKEIETLARLTGGGSGWLPFALLALTGGAAGVAYWAGVRRRTPTRETVGASQYEATLEKWRRAKEEAERRLREAEEAERKAAEAERRAREAKEEAERKAKEEAARKAKEEAARKAKEEAARKASAATAASFASNVGDAEYQAGTRTTLSIKGVEYAFRYCPPGTFTMGSPESEEGRCRDEMQHEVTLTNGFWMLETPVTQAMWKSAMGNNPSDFSADGYYADEVCGMDTSNFPVECVAWEDCQNFIKKLNSQGLMLDGFKFRLPSEAEWEYACRAGTTGPYAGSSLDSLGWYWDNSDGRTHEVGTKSANPWGLYDMHGNVWEWCADRYDCWYYEKLANARLSNIRLIDMCNPINERWGASRVLRGGSWGGDYYDDGADHSCDAESCRSAYRYLSVPTRVYSDCGFRLALNRER